MALFRRKILSSVTVALPIYFIFVALWAFTQSNQCNNKCILKFHLMRAPLGSFGVSLWWLFTSGTTVAKVQCVIECLFFLSPEKPVLNDSETNYCIQALYYTAYTVHPTSFLRFCRTDRISAVTAFFLCQVFDLLLCLINSERTDMLRWRKYFSRSTKVQTSIANICHEKPASWFSTFWFYARRVQRQSHCTCTDSL